MHKQEGSRRGPRRPESELRARSRVTRETAADTPLFATLDDSLASVERDESRRAHESAPFEPDRWTRMARAVGLAPDAPVIVALSGGADSVYLLQVVAAARPRPRMCAVHVEHGLRGSEGLEDAAFCERVCRDLDVPFVVRRLDLDRAAPSLEARAREARYRALCEEAARLAIPTILTGHHADDALETLLQRWLRGTDLSGLAGLRTRLHLPAGSAASAQRADDRDGIDEAASDAPSSASERSSDSAAALRSAGERLNPTDLDVDVVRPLIALRREEVRQSLRERGLEWREDGSNESPRFTRNRVRKLFLPEIERVCGDAAIENLRAFGHAVETLEERCAELTAGIAWEEPAFAAACRGGGGLTLGGTLPRKRLTELSPTLRRRALWRLIAEGTGHAPTRGHLEALLADLALGRCRRHSLPGRWSLQLRSSVLHLEPPPALLSSEALPAVRPDPVAPAQRSPQLEFPFVAHERAPFPRAPAESARVLELPGLAVLDDGRSISAELVTLPPSSDVPRSLTCVELDADALSGELTVRWPRPGDRFRALGAPGSKSLSRFFADVGLPRRDRARVPLVFDGPELIWVAGIRPCESRRVRYTTRERLRLTLHPVEERGPSIRAPDKVHG